MNEEPEEPEVCQESNLEGSAASEVQHTSWPDQLNYMIESELTQWFDSMNALE